MSAEQRVEARRRRTRAEVEQLVAEFESSGMRRSEFCRSRGLSWGTLNRHLKRQRKKRPAVKPVGRRLLTVELAGPNRTGQRESGGLAVVLATGRRIEVGSGFDTHTLERLVSALERV
jgi:hypothetical protein